MKLVRRKLGDIAQIIGGATPSTKIPEYWDGGIPWITPKDLSGFEGTYIGHGSRSISQSGLENSSAKILPTGTVLYTSRAPIGYVAIASVPVATNQGFKSLVLNDGYVPEFVYYLLKFSKSEIESFSSGGTFAEISARALAEVELGFPDERHQHAIAEVLVNLDSKIQANQKTSRLLEEIAGAIFKSWFIDFDPVKIKMTGEKPDGMDALTAALFPDSMEDSELGLIPKGWVVKPLFDFELKIESGARPKGGVKGIADGVPSIGAESINGIGVFDFSKTKYVSEEFYEKMNKGKPKDFDVLLYKDGGKPGEFKPRVGMFGKGFPFEKYAINEHVFLLRSDELGPAFTYFWIRMERTLDVLRNRGIKAAIPGINQQDVGTLPVLWPHSELIEKFTELSMPYLELILSLASESLELSRLRDALLPRLMSGELEIPQEMMSS